MVTAMIVKMRARALSLSSSPSPSISTSSPSTVLVVLVSTYWFSVFLILMIVVLPTKLVAVTAEKQQRQHRQLQGQQEKKEKPRPNVLIIMTDQQRYDAISYVQNNELRDLYDGYTKIRTPNIDRLIENGVYFKNAYTQCPVCGPSRTSFRTGCTIERTGVQHNDLAKEYYNSGPIFQQRVESLTSLDHILVEELNYTNEYYGKFHMPEPVLMSKQRSFEFVVQQGKEGKDVDDDENDKDNDKGKDKDNDNDNDDGSGTSDGWTWSEIEGAPLIRYNDYDYSSQRFYFKFDAASKKVRRHLEYFDGQGLISKDIVSDGEQIDTYTRYPYIPIGVDRRVDFPSGTPLTASEGFESVERSQSNVVGLYALSESYTPSFFVGDVAVKALERLVSKDDDQPWFLTASFHSPHPPMVPSWRHLQYYWDRRNDIRLPPNMDDPMINSAYRTITEQIPAYSDPEKVKEWTAAYYGLVEECDEWIGALLDTLVDGNGGGKDDDWGNTLIVFTSDHGEMLGSHQKRDKNNFYEESVKVPLVFSLRDTIPPGLVIDDMVSHIDVFGTVLDYIGASGYDRSDGKSLRSIIEHKENAKEYDVNFVVSEWDFRKPLLSNPDLLDRDIDDRPSFMVRKGRFKLLIQKLANTDKMDMMFDLKEDPWEMNNLLGENAMKADDAVIAKAEHLKCLLLDWMTRSDGYLGYYSNPLNNYDEGSGDLMEVKNRRSWRDIDFWVSDREVEFGSVGMAGSEYVRHEFLYLGTTVSTGKDTVVKLSIVSDSRGKDESSVSFTLDKATIVLTPGSCESVRITFASADDSWTEGLSETILLVESEGNRDFQTKILLHTPSKLPQILK